MKKVWSISTTLRNPERARNFLIALNELRGQVWNRENQKRFQVLLIQKRFYGAGKTQFYNGLTDEQVRLIESGDPVLYEQAEEILDQKDYEGGGDMRGRNSYKPLEKTGYVYINDDGRIQITSLGNYLISDDYNLGEIYFKWLLKWQYPNPDSRDFRARDGYNIKPFIGTLHLINRVNNLCLEREVEPKGISKLEFALFVPTLINYGDIENQANKLFQFREEYQSLGTAEEHDMFIDDYIRRNFSDFENASFKNLCEYTDNIIRNFRLSRYLRIRGGGYYVDIEERRMIEVKRLLETNPGNAVDFLAQEYRDCLSDMNLPTLPWENVDEMKEIQRGVLEEVNQLEAQLGENISETPQDTDSVADLNESIQRLREHRSELQNLMLKAEFDEVNKIDDAISALQNIRSLDEKPSIALEKWVTIGLHIINDAVKIKPNYLVDDDNNVVFTAPGNRPDIECFYQEFNSICEVTLLTDRSQWFNEGQPVMRHIRDFEDKFEEQDVYCLFVAPRLHRDTVNTFWISVKYEYEGVKQKIIPLTLSQFIKILEVIKKLKQRGSSLSHNQLMGFYDNVVNSTDTLTNSDSWVEGINAELENWCEALTN